MTKMTMRSLINLISIGFRYTESNEKTFFHVESKCDRYITTINRKIFQINQNQKRCLKTNEIAERDSFISGR